jgi:hypothetical protein
MKTIIPAPAGYQLLRVWEDWSADTTPILAFVVDPDAYECVPDVVTVTGDTINQPDDRPHTAIQTPTLTVIDFFGQTWPNAAAYVKAYKALVNPEEKVIPPQSKQRLRAVR